MKKFLIPCCCSLLFLLSSCHPCSKSRPVILRIIGTGDVSDTVMFPAYSIPMIDAAEADNPATFNQEFYDFKQHDSSVEFTGKKSDTKDIRLPLKSGIYVRKKGGNRAYTYASKH